jgi:four helix bundle protein
MIRTYRDLKVWKRGMGLVQRIYELTSTFPRSERDALVSQLQRAAVSIPSNIAEGWGYRSRKQYIHYLYIARCSLFEVETQISIAKSLGYITKRQEAEALEETDVQSRMLLSLIRSLEKT